MNFGQERPEPLVAMFRASNTSPRTHSACCTLKRTGRDGCTDVHRRPRRNAKDPRHPWRSLRPFVELAGGRDQSELWRMKDCSGWRRWRGPIRLRPPVGQGKRRQGHKAGGFMSLTLGNCKADCGFPPTALSPAALLIRPFKRQGIGKILAARERRDHQRLLAIFALFRGIEDHESGRANPRGAGVGAGMEQGRTPRGASVSHCLLCTCHSAHVLTVVDPSMRRMLFLTGLGGHAPTPGEKQFLIS